MSATQSPAASSEVVQCPPPGGGPLEVDYSLSVKGRGLNSIPVRFALMSAVFTAICASALTMIVADEHSQFDLALALVLLGIVLVPSAITFFAGSKLASAIRSLRESTEAIVAGDLDSPIDVDCACEVGGLADSFRAMVARMNRNIVRMNVLAYSDPVTGLANRAVITHLFGSVMDLRKCGGALVFIDLDDFKKINDTLGHRTGDELLRIVSNRIIRKGFGLDRSEIDDCTSAFGELRQSCPEGVVFARYAGDEFVAFFPGPVSRYWLEERARNVVEAVGNPFPVHGNNVRISASVGIAMMPTDTDDPEQLLSYADLAMYAAKEAGKNCYKFFDHSLRDLAIERSRIEEDLRIAIAEEALTLQFQPKVDVGTMEVRGVEALVRWHHPVRGNIPPDDFIGIAEQRGLMPELGNCVMNMAVKQARKWLDEGRPTRIAVNVSAAQFERAQLVPEILSALERHKVDPALIEIEITETMVMSDFARTHERMQRLREVGVRISIDDFGTGFSNLSQLARLPFSILKIDRSLIADIGQNPKSEAIIKAIVSMAHALGHEVIAEGIEQVEQYAFLRRLGCDQAQGFLFGTPMLASEFPGWVDNLGQSEVASQLNDLKMRLAVG